MGLGDPRALAPEYHEYTDEAGVRRVIDLNTGEEVVDLGKGPTTPPPLRSPDMEVFGDRKMRFDHATKTWIDEGEAPAKAPTQPIRLGGASNAQTTMKNIEAEVERSMGRMAFMRGGPEVQAALEAAAIARGTTWAELTAEAEKEYATGLEAPPGPAAAPAPVGGLGLMSLPLSGGLQSPPGAPMELSPAQEAIIAKIQNDEPLTPEEIEEYQKMRAAQGR